MDIFTDVLRQNRTFFLRAAITAAHQLGLPDHLSEPAAASTIADLIGASPGRLRSLLDVLAAEGLLIRKGAPPRYSSTDPLPAAEELPREGWGRLAEVICTDTPLDIEAGPEAPRTCARYHEHLRDISGEAAEELASLPEGPVRRVLDAGGGMGGYTAAFLDAWPCAEAVLIDKAPVVELAREELARFGDRAVCEAGDLLEMSPEPVFDVVLLSNVLHLFGPAACSELVRRAASGLAPGGMLLIKDLYIAPDRSGPPLALWFSLNMALYTEAGDVYAVERVRRWLQAAGLMDIQTSRLKAAPESVVIVGGADSSMSPELP